MSRITTPGEILREARKAKGWTQQELGDRLGMGQGKVAALELGRPNNRRSLEWYLARDRLAVWDELGIDPADFAAALVETPDGLCPCCRRPL